MRRVMLVAALVLCGGVRRTHAPVAWDKIAIEAVKVLREDHSPYRII